MSLYNTNIESEVDGSYHDEVAITDEVDTVEKPIDGWHIFGTECPKEEIVFLCQVIILYTVIVVSIYNLTVAHDDPTLWTAHRNTLPARLVQRSKRQIDYRTRRHPGYGQAHRRRLLRQSQCAR